MHHKGCEISIPIDYHICVTAHVRKAARNVYEKYIMSSREYSTAFESHRVRISDEISQNLLAMGRLICILVHRISSLSGVNRDFDVRIAIYYSPAE